MLLKFMHTSTTFLLIMKTCEMTSERARMEQKIVTPKSLMITMTWIVIFCLFKRIAQIILSQMIAFLEPRRKFSEQIAFLQWKILGLLT